MEATHEMILAGLRRKIGPDGDLQAAYHQWYCHQRDLAARRLDVEAAKISLKRAQLPTQQREDS